MNVLILCSLCCFAAGEDSPAGQSVMLILGAGGAEQYRAEFDQWANQWREAAEKAGAELISIGDAEDLSVTDRDLLQQHLKTQLEATDETLWLVLIGHGTFDGQAAKFNLRGPDVTAAELARWLKPCQRPLAIINCASASGPFINALSGPNRVIVTATKSGYEFNYARFGQFMAAAINDDTADLDKDEQVSILEAFLAASSRVGEFYEQEARLTTEHALIDDNGDSLGTPSDWFRGVRASRTAKDGAEPDGLRANQFHLLRNPREQNLPLELRRRRDQLERDIENLRREKEEQEEDAYYAQLEEILVELARLYEPFERSEPAVKDIKAN